ncbi:Holliday junction resolvase RuvX [Candidatus Uabimicrobium amorphum]|uniref:Putative pre-16S rRNA nuclease n=1 Tax=Uabimicrobium amorphum TaxID=2596890 RepID=A0A5S9INE2_UABAM|nr:Holliday junction resolvase RuvX [Candidatus Uabimicrobium amorphum]BBM84260.1 putative pre-16S rRNA nuclease [Candidatus Uabimicrobium amorphum]
MNFTKILGIDYGRRRIGVAICGPLGIANPLTVITRKNNNVFDEFAEIIEENDVSKIVMGLPKNMDNTEGEMVKEVKEFAQELQEKFDIPIDFCDERLSSWEAQNSLKRLGMSPSKRKKIIDAVAAALILQNYVDQQK